MFFMRVFTYAFFDNLPLAEFGGRIVYAMEEFDVSKVGLHWGIFCGGGRREREKREEGKEEKVHDEGLVIFFG